MKCFRCKKQVTAAYRLPIVKVNGEERFRDICKECKPSLGRYGNSYQVIIN